MRRPNRCHPKNRHKSWLTEDQAKQKAKEYGLNAYPCFDHWHLGGKHPRLRGLSGLLIETAEDPLTSL